jgi:hypothetical protein
MTLLPGWNSLDSASWAAHWLHITAIVVLGLLFLAEGLALVYDSRKDALVAAAESTAANQRRQEQEQADERHRAELAEVQRQLEQTRRQQAHRRLTSDQQKSLVAALSAFPGQKIQIGCILGDTEGQQLASDFVAVFRAAKWDDGGGSGFSQSVYTMNPVGVEVAVKEATSDKVPAPLATLVVALVNFGLIPGRNIDIDPALPADAIKLTIGMKP